MAAYLVVDVEVTDAQGYEVYRKQAQEIIATHGGRYLVRGGAVRRLEGDTTLHRFVVVEFADVAKLTSFYHSPEYQRLIPLRQRASRSSLFAVEGV